MLFKVYITNSPPAPHLNARNFPKQEVIWNLQINVPAKHDCKILNLFQLLNINCKRNGEYTTDCCSSVKRKLEQKSRATVNIVPSDFSLQMFKKDPKKRVSVVVYYS